MGGTWDATNVVDGRVAVVTNVSVDHVEYLGPTPRADRAGEGRHREARRHARARRDRSRSPGRSSRPRRRGARVPARRRLRRARATCSRSAAGSSIFAARARSTPTCSCRCTARTRPTTPRSRSRRPRASSARRSPFEVVADAFARVQSPGRLEVVGRQPLVLLDGAHNVAGAQALRAALDEEFAPAPRTLVVGLLREKEPREMLTALGLDDVDGMLVCCRPPSPRALDADGHRQGRGRPRASRRITSRSSTACRGRVSSGAARDAAPTARSSITGSLYVVGAARADARSPERRLLDQLWARLASSVGSAPS